MSSTTVSPNEEASIKVKRKRRSFSELQRNVVCPFEFCARRYASQHALHQHLRIKHTSSEESESTEKYLKNKSLVNTSPSSRSGSQSDISKRTASHHKMIATDSSCVDVKSEGSLLSKNKSKKRNYLYRRTKSDTNPASSTDTDTISAINTVTKNSSGDVDNNSNTGKRRRRSKSLNYSETDVDKISNSSSSSSSNSNSNSNSSSWMSPFSREELEIQNIDMDESLAANFPHNALFSFRNTSTPTLTCIPSKVWGTENSNLKNSKKMEKGGGSFGGNGGGGGSGIFGSLMSGLDLSSGMESSVSTALDIFDENFNLGDMTVFVNTSSVNTDKSANLFSTSSTPSSLIKNFELDDHSLLQSIKSDNLKIFSLA